MLASLQKQLLASSQDQKESFSNDYKLLSNLEAKWEYYDSYEDRLQKFIEQKIKVVNEVEYIYCRRQEQLYFVWVLINKFDPAVRRKIYQREKEIIRMFPEEIFDFYVIARMNKPAQSIISQPGIELIYQKPQ